MSSLINVTIDDFDPLISYSDYAAWTTPDPSINPTWFNATRDVTGSVWHEATYHLTTTPSARVLFNVTSSAVYIYGASNGTYTLTIDPQSAQPYTQTITPQSGSKGNPSAGADARYLLWGSDQLRWDRHEVVLENKEGGLLVDLVTIAGATGEGTRNTTIEDTSSAIRYSGNWTTQNGPTFSNGTSTYTQSENSFALDFTGSAIYLYGDQVNDHGFYQVYVDQGDKPWENGVSPNATFNDRSGCGGGWAKACEKLSGLKYFVGGLGEGRHAVAVRNLGVGSYPGPPTFFDFDRAIVTVPDRYNTQARQAGPCPFISCNTTSPSGSASGSASVIPSASAVGPSAAASSRAAGIKMDAGSSMEGMGIAALAVLLLRSF